MKITLKNFRCWKNKSFVLNNPGLILISGSSGKGKSSILQAIYFCLYGCGNKLVSYGETSMEVELVLDDMIITRTKKPNRLLLNFICDKKEYYENDTAQEIINKKFGINYEITGYIAQSGVNSFIMMSPTEKLSFLEKFAFRDIDILKLKIKCKDYISQIHDEQIKITSQLDMSREILKKMIKPDKIDFPYKCKKESRTKYIKNQEIRYNNSCILIKRLEQQKEHLTMKLNDTKLIQLNLKNKRYIIFNTNKKLLIKQKELNQLNSKFKGIEYIKNQEKLLDDYYSSVKFIKLKEEYQNNLIKLNDLEQKEINKIIQEIESIDNILWKEWNEQEIIKQIDDIKEFIKLSKLEQENYVDLIKHKENIKNLEFKKSELEKYKSLLDDKKKQKYIYTCPKCESKLNILNNKLCIIEQQILLDNYDSSESDLENFILNEKKNISNLSKIITINEEKIEKYNKIKPKLDSLKSEYEEIPEITELEQELKNMDSYIVEQKNLIKQKNTLNLQLKTKKYSLSFQEFKQTIQEQEILLSKYNIDDNIYQQQLQEIDKNFVKNTIIDQKNILSSITKINNEVDLLNNELLSYQSEFESDKSEYLKKYQDSFIQNLKSIETDLHIIDKQNQEITIKINYITDQIEKIRENKINQEKIKSECDNIKQQIKQFLNYEIEQQKYDEWIEKIKNLEYQEKEISLKYAAAITFKQKILEAESMALSGLIDSINTHAQTYLDIFFPENPILVELQGFKESKNKKIAEKPQINLNIEYKDMEADITMLSGGEISRIILAFTLALSEIYNTPIIMLDECTASLDQDLTTIVFDAIKENFNNKLVVIIAHQIIKGSFDQVIEV